MEERTYGGVSLQCSDEGYLTDLNDWNKEIALAIASDEGIQMSDKHWDVVDFLQDQCKKEVPLTIRKIGKSGVVNIKEFYQLFPGGPLKKASKIAGIPKPVSCI